MADVLYDPELDGLPPETRMVARDGRSFLVIHRRYERRFRKLPCLLTIDGGPAVPLEVGAPSVHEVTDRRHLLQVTMGELAITYPIDVMAGERVELWCGSNDAHRRKFRLGRYMVGACFWLCLLQWAYSSKYVTAWGRKHPDLVVLIYLLGYFVGPGSCVYLIVKSPGGERPSPSLVVERTPGP